MLLPVKQGYKSPGDVRVPWALAALAKYFPKTVLMVGIRHPVWWFQSLYNFKVQNLPRHLPANYWGDPNKLIGKCTKPLDFHCVGTDKGLFHVYLAMLGKTTNTSGLHEKHSNIFGRKSYTVNLLHDISVDNDHKAETLTTWWSNRPSIIATPNPIFLFDVQQLHASRKQPESTLGLQFRRDVQSILGLDQPLGPPPKKQPGKVWDIKTQQERNVNKMDICLDKYMPLRNTLMTTAREASDWILHSGFLDSPDVHVSSRHQLENVLAHEWTKDPCVQGNVEKSG